MSFPCDECLVENTTTSKVTRIQPIFLWKVDTKKQDDILESYKLNNLTLYLLANGSVTITMILLPTTEEYHSIVIDGYNISFNRVSGESMEILAYSNLEHLVLQDNNWTVGLPNCSFTNLWLI